MKFPSLLLAASLIAGAHSAPATSVDQSSFQKTALDEHNKYRAQHSAPALIWDENLAASAGQHANACQWGHTQGGNVGENIASYSEGKSGEPVESIKAWYDEVEGYDFSTGTSKNGQVTGHFTQMVWKSTTKVGCAIQVCRPLQGTTTYGDGAAGYLVCQYSPAGNYDGKYKENVQSKN